MKLHLNMLNKSILTGMAVMMVTGSAFAGSIAGSKHDMSWETWNGGDLANGVQGQICNVCHAPHNAQNATVGPLWNHDTPTSTYTMYTSPLGTLNGAQVDTAPSGASFLCLSCHDGSVALNAFGGQTGGANNTFIGARFQLGSDLSNDHPIGIEYSETSAAADGELRLPATGTTVIIGSGADTKEDVVGVVMLDGGTTVQCSSCHDVHNHYTSGDKFLKVTKTGSQICLACHLK